jgi:hypothetical protein
MNNKIIIGVIIFLILLFLFLYDKKENITSDSGKTL